MEVEKRTVRVKRRRAAYREERDRESESVLSVVQEKRRTRRKRVRPAMMSCPIQDTPKYRIVCSAHTNQQS